MKRPETSLAPQARRLTAKRVGGLGFVVLLHAGLVAALVGGMAHRAVQVPPQLIMASLLHEAAPAPPTPAPPSPPTVKPAAPEPARSVPTPPRPRARTPTPSAITVAPTPAPPPSAAPATSEAATVAAAAPSAPSVHLAAAVDRSHSCRPPEYPTVSRRLGEEGTVVVKFLIDEEGAVVDSAVESSSGHSRLDEAARDALSLCHFKPGTVDGKPERAWARIQYIWRLE